ncbi:response regulator transcription factor [soil metagenome]
MKVLLVDDHPLILLALKTVIEGMGENINVVVADCAAAAREAIRRQTDFQLVLLDLELGDASGFDVLDEFRTSYPTLPVVVMSASDRGSDVIRAIDQGAMGFVPKRTSTEMLSQALKLVMAGGIYVPPMSFGQPLPGDAVPNGSVRGDGSGGKSPRFQEQSAGIQPPMASSIEGLALTPRQADVLALLLRGMPNKIIARELGVTPETVKDHVAAVLKVLGVNSRTQAVLAVGQMGQRDPTATFSTLRPTKS